MDYFIPFFSFSLPQFLLFLLFSFSSESVNSWSSLWIHSSNFSNFVSRFWVKLFNATETPLNTRKAMLILFTQWSGILRIIRC